MTFYNLTSDQVNSVFQIYSLLRKLGVIGRLMTTTSRAYVTESGRPIRYNLTFVSYDPTYKGATSPEEYIAEIFRSVMIQRD